MKNLKFLLLAVISFISFNLFSQIITQNTSSTGLCDGSAYIDSVLIPFITPTSISWSSNGSVIQQGGTAIFNLCPGNYSIDYTGIFGNPVTSYFTIGVGTCMLTATINVTNCTGPQSCDGTATAVPNGGTAPYTFSWQNGSTGSICQNLCPGQTGCYIVDANGCSITAYEIISIDSPDTLIITGGNCNSPVDTIVNQVEDCLFNFNSVDTAYLSSVILPTNPLDSMVINWVFTDTTGLTTTIQSFTSLVNVSGCYNFTLILFCSQKSLNVKTIIVNDSYDLSLSGLNELNLERRIVGIFDMMGRNSNLIENTLLIVQYSDGSTERLMITK